MTLDVSIGNSHKETLIEYWMEKARESLESAKSEYKADRLSLAVNRAYYACLYAASTVMRNRGKMYKKNKGIRSAIHRDLISDRQTVSLGIFPKSPELGYMLVLPP